MEVDYVLRRQKLLESIRDVAIAKGWKIATAESCTGGGVSKALTDLPGSSAWFECGLVTYSNQRKENLLGVHRDTLEKFGAVSRETVEEMVGGALEQSGADLAVAISGIAGPQGGSVEKPVGMVWFAWKAAGGKVATASRLFTGDRRSVREQAINVALEGLLVAMNQYLSNS